MYIGMVFFLLEYYWVLEKFEMKPVTLHTEWSLSQMYLKELYALKIIKIDFLRIVTVLRSAEIIIMDTGAEMQKVFRMSPGNIGVHFLFHIVHLILSIWFIILSVAQTLESFLISIGYSESYQTLNIHKVKYLAVVIDSEEAKQTEKVIRLLEWFKKMGLKKVCLYDTEGVLKKSKDFIEDLVRDSVGHQHIDVHFTSFDDGKEAIAKAANFLFKKYYSDSIQGKPNIAELHMAEALNAVGYGGPEPDLLLIYGPARIHLGFPAWRIRYTEIVHMGSLNSMKFGLLTKAIHKFTMVHQNYGT